MGKDIKRVAITGGAGQIAYNLLFRIASGEMLGAEQDVALHLLEIPQALEALQGVVMELEDCAFPLLKEVVIGSDPQEVFRDVDWALLVGAKPRGPGMERKDLLMDNGHIFVGQGKAIGEVAKPDVRVLVVGNPCNTNCLIAMSHAPRVPRENFHAMTRLDQNRAEALLAKKAGVSVQDITKVTIWGNHSATQVPDFVNALVKGKAVPSVIQDENWLSEEFIPTVQQRGAAIIKARGKSSAASAANAIIDHVRSLTRPTPEGQWFSSGVCTDGKPYGLPENLIFSLPCRSTGDGNYSIIDDVAWNAFLEERIRLTEKELLEERHCVTELLRRVMV